MKSKFKLVVLTWMVSCTLGFAQQDPQYSLYMFNTMSLNPAYAGSRDVLNVTMLYRNQWSGIKGAPESVTIAADMPVMNEKIGLGAMVYKDKIGIENNTGLYLSYAQRIRITNAGTLALGGTLGGSLYSADVTNATLYLGQSDVVFTNNVNKFVPNLGLGVYYSTDKWYTGISMPRTYNNQLYSDKSLTISASQARHYFLMAGFVKKMGAIVVVKPSFMVKAVTGAPVQVDLNLNVWFYNKFSVGASYRNADAIIGIVEFIPAQGWKLGYAYDYTISDLSNSVTSGSNEIMLRYEFAGSKSKVISPRYF